MSHLVTVTGATGHIGRGIAEHLLSTGHRVRGIIRNEDKFAHLSDKGAEFRLGGLTDTEFLTEAFRGSDAVFAVIPPNPFAQDIREDQRRTAKSLVEAIKGAGVTHVVALSSIGGSLPEGTGPIAGLHDFEELLKTVPDVSVVVLRPTYFMENFLYSIPMIKGSGINGGTVRGDIPMPMIATRDIAAAAAEYLATRAFERQTVQHLLGPRDYTFREATSILGGAVGKPDLPYVEFSSDDYRNGLLGAGFTESVADAYIEMETAMNDGRIQGEVQRTESNTTPTTLEEFARDTFAPAFNGTAVEAKA